MKKLIFFATFAMIFFAFQGEAFAQNRGVWIDCIDPGSGYKVQCFVPAGTQVNTVNTTVSQQQSVTIIIQQPSPTRQNHHTRDASHSRKCDRVHNSRDYEHANDRDYDHTNNRALNRDRDYNRARNRDHNHDDEAEPYYENQTHTTSEVRYGLSRDSWSGRLRPYFEVRRITNSGSVQGQGRRSRTLIDMPSTTHWPNYSRWR